MKIFIREKLINSIVPETTKESFSAKVLVILFTVKLLEIILSMEDSTRSLQEIYIKAA